MTQLYITARDKAVLRFIFENRVATIEQIHRKFFNGRCRAIVSRRICKLQNAGCLIRNATLLNNRAKYFFKITKKAFDYICESWEFEVDTPHFLTESPNHDLLFGECRHKLENLSTVKEFYTENLLQSASYLQEDPLIKPLADLQADAALVTSPKKSPDCLYGVEFEISRKNHDRYYQKLVSYYLSHVVDAVLYICGDQQIINAVVKADKAISTTRRSKLYFALEENVLKSSSSIIFENYEGHKLELI